MSAFPRPNRNASQMVWVSGSMDEGKSALIAQVFGD